VLGVEWANLGYVGAFLVGAFFSAVVILRLARIIAQYLSELGRKEPPNEPDR
jgi:hypothetical protein